MTFLADSHSRARRFQHRFRDEYDPNQPRDPKGQWSALIGYQRQLEGLTAAVRTPQGKIHIARTHADIEVEGEPGFVSNGKFLTREETEKLYHRRTSEGIRGQLSVLRQFHSKDATNQIEPLYVRRDVLNGKDIVDWAKSAGFQTTLLANDMHVTLCYSKKPVDWSKAGWIGSPTGGVNTIHGGNRSLKQFGEAIVLAFDWNLLSKEHEDFMRAGASFDFSIYQPHITITWDVRDFDWKNVKPYEGPITVGPKIFEPIKEGWKEDIVEDAARKTPQHKHPKSGKFVTRQEAIREWGRTLAGKFGTPPPVYRRRSQKAQRLLAEMGEVDVLTAEDDRVCRECVDISEGGPYPIDEAEGLIPAHPNCRCVFVPLGFGNN